MAGLTLRDIPDDTLRWLRKRAAEHARSLNAELLDILRVVQADEAAEGRRDHPVAATLIRARRIGLRTAPTSRSVVRADRDRQNRR